MKLILLADVQGVGKKGDIVEVSEGYGRNFLLPKKLALPGNEANINKAKAEAATKAHHKAKEADEAKLLASQLEKVAVTLPVKIGEGGKLFGSVGGKDIAKVLKQEKGIDIDKKKIALDREVTGVGEYTATLKLHPAASAKIKVTVVEG